MRLDSSAFVADPDLVRALLPRSRPVACDSERVLFTEDERAAGLYILQEGSATLRMSSRDGETIFSIEVLQGSLLGVPALVGEHPYTSTATAHAGARVRFVSRGDFAAIVPADPLLSLKMLELLSAEVRSARNALHRE